MEGINHLGYRYSDEEGYSIQKVKSTQQLSVLDNQETITKIGETTLFSSATTCTCPSMKSFWQQPALR